MNNWGEFKFNEPYTGKEIKVINNVTLPKQYLDFMKKHNGGEGDIGETWFVLYRMEELEEANNDEFLVEYLPNHMIIGSNGAGELYGIDSDGNYFNVPDMIDEDDVTVFGKDLDTLPDEINKFWKR